jgi:membrane-associated protein
MDFLLQFFDFVVHLDAHLVTLFAEYGVWLYAILFLIVFCETGLVVTPLLPGDSLLFLAGALAASDGAFDIRILIPVLLAAAILGDNANYWIGRWVGASLLKWGDGSRFFNRNAFELTQNFYVKHGGKTMLVARFLPFVRTFAPFVAGIGVMHYGRYFFYDFAGALLWVLSMTLLGFWFGNVPWVKANLLLIVLGMIAIPGCGVVYTWLRQRFAAPAS